MIQVSGRMGRGITDCACRLAEEDVVDLTDCCCFFFPTRHRRRGREAEGFRILNFGKDERAGRNAQS